MSDGSEKRVERVQAVFDEWASAGRADSMADSHAPFARIAFKKLRLRPRSSYLDIGCGNGYTVRWAASASPEGRCVGIDTSSEMVALATGLSQQHANVEFIHSSFPYRRFKENSFDAVFSMEAFYYLPDLPESAREVSRILKPGGCFACMVDYYTENTVSHTWPSDVGVHMELLDEIGWRTLMEDAELRVAEQCRVTLPRETLRDEEPGHEVADWKVTEGSLLTLSRKPAQ